MVSAWGVDEPDEERREEKPGKTSVLIGSLLQAQIYGMTCSKIGSMCAKMQNKSRRLAEHVRIEINWGLGKMLMRTAKKASLKLFRAKTTRKGETHCLGLVMQFWWRQGSGATSFCSVLVVSQLRGHMVNLIRPTGRPGGQQWHCLGESTFRG